MVKNISHFELCAQICTAFFGWISYQGWCIYLAQFATFSSTHPPPPHTFYDDARVVCFFSCWCNNVEILRLEIALASGCLQQFW
jgi:hypothetical protein